MNHAFPIQGGAEHRNPKFPVSRRQFLATGSLAAAAGFTGCKSTCKLPQKPLPKPAGHFYVDSHGHIFNGADIPIKGFVYNVLLQEHAEAWWLPFAKLIVTPILEEIQRNHQDWTKEDRLLDGLLTLQAAKELAENPTGDAMISRRILHDLLDGECEKADQRIHERLMKELSSVTGVKEFDEMKDFVRPLEKQLGEALVPEQLREIVKWLGRLAKYRVFNLHEWVTTYPEIDLFLPSFLDVEAWIKMEDRHFKDESDQKVSIENQVTLYGKMARLYRGRVLPFVGYDPRREVEGGGSLKDVKRALKDHGFAGVKLYPPMGFQGYKNEEKYEELGRKAFGQKLDTALLKLYDECSAKDACILTHCEDSMEVTRGDKLNGHPLFWNQLLTEKSPAYDGLRLNLGHFGGMSDLDNVIDETGENRKGWARYIARDMMTPGSNVYIDVGDFNSMRKKDAAKAYHTKLKVLIEGGEFKGEPVIANPDVARKIMYGSDWYMVAKEPGSGCYLHYWFKAQKKHFPLNMPNFFGDNAMRYLGLHDPNSGSYKRLIGFFAQHGITPEWAL